MEKNTYIRSVTGTKELRQRKTEGWRKLCNDQITATRN